MDAVRSCKQALYIAQAQAIAEKLTALGFVFGSNYGFHFSPQSETMRDLAERLIAVYGQKLVPVTHLIHSKPDRLREFSGALKMKREK